MMDRKWGSWLARLAPALCAAACQAAEPNDDWGLATDLGLARQVTDRIDFSTPAPDTTLGVFDEADGLLDVDDDGSFFGDGLASAFIGYPVNPDGSIRFAVSGFGDEDFDGLIDGAAIGHGESGGFDVLLTVSNADGRVIESRDLAGTLVPGEAIRFPDPRSRQNGSGGLSTWNSTTWSARRRTSTSGPSRACRAARRSSPR